MRAILIDTYNREVREADFDGDYRSIYKLLSTPEHEVGTFEAVGINEHERVFIDEEGLLKADDDPEIIKFFVWKGYPQPLAGNGLILGEDETGESVATQLSLDYVREHVSFPNIEMAGWAYPKDAPAEVDHPVFGKTAVVFGPAPVFAEKKGGS